MLPFVPAQATVIYSVSSTRVVNCSGAPHGLWTASDIVGGSCSNCFDIQEDSTFTIFDNDANSANWIAVLDATAENPQRVLADILITLSGFSMQRNIDNQLICIPDPHEYELYEMDITDLVFKTDGNCAGLYS